MRRAIIGGAALLASGGAIALGKPAEAFWSSRSDALIQHHKIVIIGGGTSGLTVASQLLKHAGWDSLMKFGASSHGSDVAVIEPSDQHYYLPMLTMVAGGLKQLKNSHRDMEKVMPEKSLWIQDSVKELNPGENTVTLQSGDKVSYDYLVVASGLQRNWGKVPGMKEALDAPDCPVVSVHAPQYAEKARVLMENFKGGEVLFVSFDAGWTPMWLFEASFRARGIRDKAHMFGTIPNDTLFPVEKYAGALQAHATERCVAILKETELVRVLPEERVVVLRNVRTKQEVRKAFDILHVSPPVSSPDFLARSPLADSSGYCGVDKETLQHSKFGNVFAIGDCTSLPTARSAAAIASQAPVLVHNLIAIMQREKTLKEKDGKSAEALPAKYDGYTGIPIMLGDGKLLLPEFCYEKKPKETFPWDQSKPSSVLYWIKKEFFPVVYWYGFIRGSWYGRNHFVKPPYPEDLLFRD